MQTQPLLCSAYKASLVALATVALTSTAFAESDWSIKFGPARVSFSESASFSANGTPYPGASATISDRTTIALELTYRLTDSLRLGFTGGVPPTSTVTGTGGLAPLGELGKVTYAPAVMALQYHFARIGGIQPYLAAGAVYFLVTDTGEGAVKQLSVDNKFGAALQAGASYRVTPTISVFADLKKFYVKTNANGVSPALGGAPVSARITLNPLVFHTGLAFDF